MTLGHDIHGLLCLDTLIDPRQRLQPFGLFIQASRGLHSYRSPEPSPSTPKNKNASASLCDSNEPFQPFQRLFAINRPLYWLVPRFFGRQHAASTFPPLSPLRSRIHPLSALDSPIVQVTPTNSISSKAARFDSHCPISINRVSKPDQFHKHKICIL
jgi:hypothetical protein